MAFSIIKKLALSLFLFVIILIPVTAAPDEDPNIVCWGRGYLLVLDMIYMFPEAEESMAAFGKTPQANEIFQKLLDRDYDSKAVLEMELQPETAASYRPSHIILKSYMKNSTANIAKLGIPLIFIDMESPEQYVTDLKTLGEVFGNSRRAEELINYFNTERQEVVRFAGGFTESEKPRVLFLYYSVKGGSTSLMVPPAEWIQSRMVEWAGGVPVWKDSVAGQNWNTISFEQIATWNPDTIFLVSYHSDVEAVKAKLTSDPLWKMLEAGKQERIYAFPGDFLSWDQSDPRWILGLNWMGTMLHPDTFPNRRMTGKLYDFYKTAYGFDSREVDEEIIPRITGDFLK